MGRKRTCGTDDGKKKRTLPCAFSDFNAKYDDGRELPLLCDSIERSSN